MSSMYIRWIIFSWNSLDLYPQPTVHFLNMWLSGIITITNNNGESASLWKIPLWIFYLRKSFSACCQFHFPVFHDFPDGIHHFVGYLVHYYYYYYFALCEFFAQALADGLSWESEWQQISLSLLELHLVSPSLSCSIFFLVPWQGPGIFFYC